MHCFLCIGNGRTPPFNFRQRKRSQDIQRSYERQYKFRMDDLSNTSETASTAAFEENDESIVEDIPPVALAVKVCSLHFDTNINLIS